MMKQPGKYSFRDLRRGCLIGLIAGVGYTLAYEIIQYMAADTGVKSLMVGLGWLLAIPVPAFLLWWLPRQISRDAEVPGNGSAEGENETGSDPDSGTGKSTGSA